MTQLLKKKKLASIIVVIIGIISIVGFVLFSPIVQDAGYHSFSDNQTFIGIPNFWNVLSNLPFLIVGLIGFIHINKMGKVQLQFWIFFAGISLVSFGSGYYHFNPNSNTLIWDRLPMTIGFTALISILISEFIDYKKGRIVLLPLLLFGIVSILYWIKFDDLRVYVLVQFYAVISIPIILILFKSDENSGKGYWFLFMAYIIAKLCESYDTEIHKLLKFISGHSLKHIIASIGIYLLIKSYIRKNNLIDKQLSDADIIS